VREESARSSLTALPVLCLGFLVLGVGLAIGGVLRANAEVYLPGHGDCGTAWNQVFDNRWPDSHRPIDPIACETADNQRQGQVKAMWFFSGLSLIVAYGWRVAWRRECAREAAVN
jgi:hypothetical protein